MASTDLHNRELLHLVDQLLEAVSSRKREKVVELLSQGAPTEIGGSDFARFYCRAKARQLQPERGVTPERAEDHQFTVESSLTAAVQAGDLEMVELLMDHGADPNARRVYYTWSTGTTHLIKPGWNGFVLEPALHLALEGQCLDMVELLLARGADPNQRDWGHIRPLEVAVRIRRPDSTRALLAAGADLALVGHERSPTLVKHEVLEAIAREIDHLDGVDNEGRSLLHRAAANDNRAVVTVLCAAGADPGLVDRQGRTPLEVAVNEGSEGAAAELIRHAHPPEKRLAGLLVDACRRASAPEVEALLAAGAPAGGDITVKMPPLAAAVRLVQPEPNPGNNHGPWGMSFFDESRWPFECELRSRVEIVRRLLAAGAAPDAGDDRGTPLHEAAARQGAGPIVEALLAGGASPSVRDERGRTPLHVAVASNDVGWEPPCPGDVYEYFEVPFTSHLEIVEHLLVAGADPDAADLQGVTAVDLARARGDDRMLRLLERARPRG